MRWQRSTTQELEQLLWHGIAEPWEEGTTPRCHVVDIEAGIAHGLQPYHLPICTNVNNRRVAASFVTTIHPRTLSLLARSCTIHS